MGKTVHFILELVISFACTVGFKACVGDEFLISIFSDNTMSGMYAQEVFITNPTSVVAHVAINDSGRLDRVALAVADNYTYPVNLTNVNNSRIVFRTLLINSSVDINVKGVFTSIGYRLHYNILPLNNLGSRYYTSYGMGFSGNTSQCCLVAGHVTKLQLKSFNNVSVTILSNNQTYVHVTEHEFDLLKHQTLCFWSSMSIYNTSLSATEPVALYCGEFNGILDMRVHLPPINRCGKSYFLPCSDDIATTENVTEYAVQRIIKLYPLYTNTTAFVNGHSYKFRHERQSNYPLDIKSDKPVCVAQYIRKWTSSAKIFFKDDDYGIILYDQKRNSTLRDCLDKKARPNSTETDDSSTSLMTTPTQSCMCPCASLSYSSLTENEKKMKLQLSLEKIQRDLTLEKSVLSSLRRRKRSASDQRPSATGIGVIGVAVLCGVVVTIVAFDYPILSKHSHMWRCKISKKCKKGRQKHGLSLAKFIEK